MEALYIRSSYSYLIASFVTSTGNFREVQRFLRRLTAHKVMNEHIAKIFEQPVETFLRDCFIRIHVLDFEKLKIPENSSN